jgi:ABC-type polysaccharide/polyol phosphate transport system ATPase subunit
VLEQVRELCERTLWLDAGRIVSDGPTADVIARYEEHSVRRSEGGGEA